MGPTSKGGGRELEAGVRRDRKKGKEGRVRKESVQLLLFYKLTTD